MKKRSEKSYSVFIRLTILIVVSVISNFGFESRNLVLIEPAPGHC